MWTYRQLTGELLVGAPSTQTIISHGYSGHGEGKNNPDMQDIRMVGPIPQGMYTIGPAFTHPKLGRITMRLFPQPGTQMFGRSEFCLHGDSLAHPGEASDGCIILPPAIRAMIEASKDRTLYVVRT